MPALAWRAYMGVKEAFGHGAFSLARLHDVGSQLGVCTGSALCLRFA